MDKTVIELERLTQCKLKGDILELEILPNELDVYYKLLGELVTQMEYIGNVEITNLEHYLIIILGRYMKDENSNIYLNICGNIYVGGTKGLKNYLRNVIYSIYHFKKYLISEKMKDLTDLIYSLINKRIRIILLSKDLTINNYNVLLYLLYNTTVYKTSLGTDNEYSFNVSEYLNGKEDYEKILPKIELLLENTSRHLIDGGNINNDQELLFISHRIGLIARGLTEILYYDYRHSLKNNMVINCLLFFNNGTFKIKHEFNSDLTVKSKELIYFELFKKLYNLVYKSIVYYSTGKIEQIIYLKDLFKNLIDFKVLIKSTVLAKDYNIYKEVVLNKCFINVNHSISKILKNIIIKDNIIEQLSNALLKENSILDGNITKYKSNLLYTFHQIKIDPDLKQNVLNICQSDNIYMSLELFDQNNIIECICTLNTFSMIKSKAYVKYFFNKNTGNLEKYLISLDSLNPSVITYDYGAISSINYESINYTIIKTLSLV